MPGYQRPVFGLLQSHHPRGAPEVRFLHLNRVRFGAVAVDSTHPQPSDRVGRQTRWGEKDRQAPRECAPAETASGRLVVEQRLRIAAPIVVAGADEQDFAHASRAANGTCGPPGKHPLPNDWRSVATTGGPADAPEAGVTLAVAVSSDPPRLHCRWSAGFRMTALPGQRSIRFSAAIRPAAAGKTPASCRPG